MSDQKFKVGDLVTVFGYENQGVIVEIIEGRDIWPYRILFARKNGSVFFETSSKRDLTLLKRSNVSPKNLTEIVKDRYYPEGKEPAKKPYNGEGVSTGAGLFIALGVVCISLGLLGLGYLTFS